MNEPAPYDPRTEIDVASAPTQSLGSLDATSGGTVPYHGQPSTGQVKGAGPRRFGDYELLEKIARGGMGVVYRARQAPLNRIVALKMILAGEFADADAVRRFQAEAQAAAQLDHPHIVPIHEIGEVEGQHFFSMGLVEGPSLAARLREGPLPNRAAAETMLIIAGAVQYAHDRGVIHRDLKPSNVLLKEQRDAGGSSAAASDTTPGGKSSTRGGHDSTARSPFASGLHPMLTDFGLAKLVQGGSELTSTGQVMGTPAYMPPEQAAGRNDEIGPLSDVYALGATLYCTLTGRPPFQAAGAVETMQQVIHCEPVPPRKLNPDVDRDLETICLKCLEKQPSRRYSTAADLAAEIQRWLQGEPILARPASSIERAHKWVRRQPVLAALLGVSLLAVVFLAALSVGYYFHRELQAERDEVERQRKSASDARDELSGRNQEIERQKAVVEVKNVEIEQQKLIVEIERDHTRRIQYASDLNMADRAWQDCQLGRMFELLSRNAPRPGANDLRGFEWYYLGLQGNWHRRSLPGTRGARVMAFAPEARLTATTGWGTFVDVWELDSQRKRITLTEGHFKERAMGDVNSADAVALTPDGRTLVIGFHNGQAMVWDLEANKLVAVVSSGGGPQPYAGSVDVTADGQRFVVGSADQRVRLWSRDEKLLGEMPLPAGSVGMVRFGPDQKRIAVANFDGKITIWNSESGEVEKTLHGFTDMATCVAWSSDGRTIAGGAYNEEVRIWDLESGQVRFLLRGHKGALNDVAFRPDGQLLASCGSDGTIRLWDLSSGLPARVVRGHSSTVFSVAWSTDGGRIVSSSMDGSTREWDLSATPESYIVEKGVPLAQVMVFSRDGSAWATTRKDGGIVIRNTAHAQVIHEFGAGHGWPWAAEFHPDGKRLADSTSDGTVRLWNLSDGKSRQLTQHPQRVADIAFSPDGSRLATVSDDHTARIVDVESGELLHTLEGHGNQVWAVAWSPDGQTVATGGHDGRLILWNPQTGQQIRQWPINNFPTGMTFSPNSQYIATPAKAQTGVDEFSVLTGELVRTFVGHADAIGGLAYSPDGRRLFSGSWDRTVKVWDRVSGQETLTLPSTDVVHRLALSPDGTTLLAVGNQSVTLWFAPVPPAQSPDGHSGQP